MAAVGRLLRGATVQCTRSEFVEAVIFPGGADAPECETFLCCSGFLRLRVFRNACGTATCVARFRQGFLTQPRRGLLPDR